MKLHPGYETRPNDPRFFDCVKTPLSEEEAAYYLGAAWKKIYGVYPSKNTHALLWAQSLGETARFKLIRNNNWANIKKRDDWEYTSYDAGEVLNGKHEMFYPYHPQTFFAHWDTPMEGAEAYIRFLAERDRYKKAWVELMAGDPVAYCKELKAAGYFTADLDHYTKGVVRLSDEFKRKYDLLIAWEPKSPESVPEPEPEPIPEPVKEEPEPEVEIQAEPEPKLDKLGMFAKIMQFLSKLLGGK